MFGRQMVSAFSLTDNLLCAFWPHRTRLPVNIPFHQFFQQFVQAVFQQGKEAV